MHELSSKDPNQISRLKYLSIIFGGCEEIVVAQQAIVGP